MGMFKIFKIIWCLSLVIYFLGLLGIVEFLNI